MVLKCEKLFELMEGHLKNNQEAVKKVGGIIHMEISEKKGADPEIWTLDLKNGQGSVKKGKEGKADATFSMIDADLINMADGKLNPQQAFMQGKMKIKGNMAIAMKFTPDLLPKQPKL